MRCNRKRPGAIRASSAELQARGSSVQSMKKRDGCSPAGCHPLGQLPPGPCRRWEVLERGRSTDAHGEMTRVASELMPVMLLLLWALQPAVRACAHGRGRLETTTSRSLRPSTWWTWPGCSQLHGLTDALKCCLQEAQVSDFAVWAGDKLPDRVPWREALRGEIYIYTIMLSRRRRETRQLDSFAGPLDRAARSLISHFYYF